MYKLVIIEDEDIIRKGIIHMAQEVLSDCRVVGEAKNGKEALKIIESTRPDILLLDINMPIMNGLELLEHLPRNVFSVIIISGQSEFEYAKRAIKFGVVDYLLKPIEETSLKNSVNKAIDQLNMRREYVSKKDDHPYDIFSEYKMTDSITLLKAIDYMEAHIDKKILLEDLVSVTGRSVTSINNRFQRDFNITFNEYITKLRMHKAIQHMQKQELHLYEIAHKVGFKDYKYFNTVFKKIVGTSPKLVQVYFTRQQSDVL